MATAITKEQYEILKDVEKVFVSVVRNEEVFAAGGSLLQQLDAASAAQQSTSLPEISHEDDVYRVGSLAAIRAIHDKVNPFLPYYLNMFPI
mmetsp:Transcript_17566/g.23731  ORF Transcript_17566/g.23731 Transcript_17566/m.23731 type:complete len:91 (+) Transcript_17566:303-575(+)